MHGLNNYVGTKAKCRHLKKLPVKDFAAGVYQSLYRLEIQSVMLVFRPSFMNCCSSNFLTPFPVLISILYSVYTYSVKGGVWGYGPQTDKHLPQSPCRGQFLFDDYILHCLLGVLSFYDC